VTSAAPLPCPTANDESMEMSEETVRMMGSREIFDDFCGEWTIYLDKDDKKFLSVLLCHFSVSCHNMQYTKAGCCICWKDEKTIRTWRRG